MPELPHYTYIFPTYWYTTEAMPLILFEKCLSPLIFNAIHFSHLCILLFMSEMISLITFQSSLQNVHMKVP